MALGIVRLAAQQLRSVQHRHVSPPTWRTPDNKKPVAGSNAQPRVSKTIGFPLVGGYSPADRPTACPDNRLFTYSTPHAAAITPAATWRLILVRRIAHRKHGAGPHTLPATKIFLPSTS